MKYHTPDLPIAVSLKKIVAFLEDIGIPTDHLQAVHIGKKTLTVTTGVLDENGSVAIRAGEYSIVTHDVEIPIARDDV